MARKPSKTIETVKAKQENVPSPSLEKAKQYFPFLLTGVYFILSLIGILNHEMWRDEYQAWMVASDAHSIPELFQNLKYEGNPVLWHAFLFILSRFSDEAILMQILHIVISTSFIFLIARYSPFSLLQKSTSGIRVLFVLRI